LHLAAGEIPDEMKLRTRDGRILSGFDAILYLMRRIWWAIPLWAIARLPIVSTLLRRAYRSITRNRQGISRACGLASNRPFFSNRVSVITEITVLSAFFAVAIVLSSGWVQMWLLALGVWMIFKLLAWHRSTRGHGTLAAKARFFCWPGMDAGPFLRPGVVLPHIALRQWTIPIIRLTLGAALIWGVAGFAAPVHPLLAGWIGMIGSIFLLHFGVFHLIALLWRARGVAVKPIMQRPLAAATLSDFWSRWNHGFRDFAYPFIFRPLHRRLGVAGATYVTFLFSGLVHDLVISIPARGGYGLPTLYFLFQAAGVLFEKSPAARFVHPIIRRALMHVTLIAPLGLLFHRDFVLRVFVPFLHAISAF
jgi:hypothetical protein